MAPENEDEKRAADDDDGAENDAGPGFEPAADHDHDLTRYAPPPPAVAELAASCVRFVTAKYGVLLDFTSETLSLVDQYVRDAHADVATAARANGDTETVDASGTPYQAGEKVEALELLQAAIGAYLGEVMRRAFGATWFCEGDYEAWRLDFTYVYLTFNPIGMAREALTLRDEGWHAHLAMDDAERGAVEARLAALPEADEATYYAPSTRYDVVEIAVNALRAKMHEDGHGEVRFTRDDYTR